jgi:hypothetical protein
MNSTAATARIISLGFITGRIHRDGSYTISHELHTLEAQLRPMVRALLESGAAIDSFEWFCELNRIAGYQALACERTAPEHFSGNRARYIEIWDAIACWSYYRAEQLRQTPVEAVEMLLAA